jgi:hypothetical protein
MSLSEAIRDIGYLAWKDDEAGLEKMKGVLWERAVKEENERWDAAVAEAVPMRKRMRFERELRDATAALTDIVFEPGWCPLTMEGAHGCPVALKEHFRAFEYCEGTGGTGGTGSVWTIRDSHNGAERYDLTYWPAGTTAPSWKKRDVGSSLAVVGGRCYYIAARRIHWYAEVRSCDALTGGDDRRELEVKTDRENAEIIRAGTAAVFVRVENSGSSSLSYLSPKTKRFVELVRMGGWQVPFGGGEAGPVYAVRAQGGGDKYEFVGTSSFAV